MDTESSQRTNVGMCEATIDQSGISDSLCSSKPVEFLLMAKLGVLTLEDELESDLKSRT